MDWQLRVALLVIGIGVIGFIFYDFNRRKKIQAEKQRLIDKMRESANQVDGLGFDINGVGHVRKAGNGLPPEQMPEINSENAQIDVSENQPHSESNQPTEFNSEITDKQSPTEQMSLTDLDSQDKPRDPDLVFSLILKAKENETFHGNDFMPILLSQGLRHGEMGIFHRHAGKGSENVLYSVANAINPGTFDIQNIQNFETPGFAFFMTVPGPNDPKMAYEAMVKTIKLLKQELGGQILDDTKSVFTEQTYHHQQERLQNYLFRNAQNH